MYTSEACAVAPRCWCLCSCTVCVLQQQQVKQRRPSLRQQPAVSSSPPLIEGEVNKSMLTFNLDNTCLVWMFAHTFKNMRTWRVSVRLLTQPTTTHTVSCAIAVIGTPWIIVWDTTMSSFVCVTRTAEWWVWLQYRKVCLLCCFKNGKIQYKVAVTHLYSLPNSALKFWINTHQTMVSLLYP